MSDSLQPWTIAGQASHPGNGPGKNTGAGGDFLLQGIFPTQGSSLSLLHLLRQAGCFITVCAALTLCGHRFSQCQCRLQDTGQSSNLLDSTACIFPSLPPGGTRVHSNAPSLSKKASSGQFSCSVMSDSLLPHGLQHTRLPCPSTTPRVNSNSCPSRR